MTYGSLQCADAAAKLISAANATRAGVPDIAIVNRSAGTNGSYILMTGGETTAPVCSGPIPVNASQNPGVIVAVH